MSKNKRIRHEKEKSVKMPAKMPVIMAAIVVIAIIVAIIIIITRNKGKQEQVGPTNEMVGITLQDTTYENMQVGNISMEYLDDNNQTMVSMTIYNTTDRTVQDEDLNAILLNENGEQVSSIQTFIKSLAPGEEYDISVVLKGNLTQTKSIKLEKVNQ